VTYAVAAGCAVAAFVLGGLAPRPAGLSRSNYRSAPVSLVGGPVLVVVLLVGLSVLRWWPAVVTVALCGAVGWYDDVYGSPAAKGLRGHLAALRRGQVTSGAVKMLVVGVAGVVAASWLHGLSARAFVSAIVVAGSANLLNLLDLRPGRALKVGLLCALPVSLVVAGAAAGLLPWDLRERVMLGDAGANALGAAVGVAVATRAPFAVCAAVAAVVVALTLASERVSFSRVIDTVAPLRWADRLGRVA
jgi:UDP-N-acetylmuramyl pentapeptide phosphotransferase/UDP-N-acetylglucosamine-1-phosphate transferase